MQPTVTVPPPPTASVKPTSYKVYFLPVGFILFLCFFLALALAAIIWASVAATDDDDDDGSSDGGPAKRALVSSMVDTGAALIQAARGLVH
jgi:hypothetical protein